MTIAEAIAAIESRAFDLRLPMGAVCKEAGVAHSTWSRARERGIIRATTLGRMEAALERLEQTKAA